MPYEVLDRRMDAMTTQLDKIMGHFHRTVAVSNAELIGDVRLSYTPQGQHYRRTTVPSAIWLSTFSTQEDSIQLHLAQRHEEMCVSGYYWGPPTLPTDAHCLAWLDMSRDGPYAGKKDCITKLSFTLGDDTCASFMKFYTTLWAGLNSCGFSNLHLLPILPRIRPDVNLTITPIVEES
jgi:hypothetical protein